MASVSPKELTAFRMAPEVMAALRAVKAKEGIPVAVQIDFAVRAWLKRKGVLIKAERKRASTRKRS
jgi:hypothetical protein